MPGHLAEVGADGRGFQGDRDGDFQDDGDFPGDMERLGKTDPRLLLDGQFEIEHLINGHLEGHGDAQLFAQAELDRDVPLDL